MMNGIKVAVRALCLPILWATACSTWSLADAPASSMKPVEKLFGRIVRDDVGRIVTLEQPDQQMEDADLRVISDVTALEVLNLAFCKRITDEGLEHLKGLPALKRVNLGGCKRVGDGGLNHLSGASRLDTLNLSVTQVSDAGLKTIAKFLMAKCQSKVVTRVSVNGIRW